MSCTSTKVNFNMISYLSSCAQGPHPLDKIKKKLQYELIVPDHKKDTIEYKKVYNQDLEFYFYVHFDVPRNNNYYPHRDTKFMFKETKCDVSFRTNSSKDSLEKNKKYKTRGGIPASFINIGIDFEAHSPMFYIKLKFFSLLARSNPITLYLSSKWDKTSTSPEIETIKFFFIMGIEQFLIDDRVCFDIKLDLEEVDDNTVSKIRDLINEIWVSSLSYLGVDSIGTYLKIGDVASITLNLPDYFNTSSNKVEENIIEGKFVQSRWDDGQFYLSNPNIFLIRLRHRKAVFFVLDWISILARSVSYLPENLLWDHPDVLQNIKYYYTDKIYNNMWLTFNTVINHWSSFVSSGKVIENFGLTVTQFLTGLASEFENTLNTLNTMGIDDRIAEENIKWLSGMMQDRIISLFTSQLLILQTQALDKFKDYLIWQAKYSNKAFEFEKGIAIIQVNEWFESKASEISVPEMRLGFSGAKKELQQVLGEVAEKFKDSAVSKLISIQKTSKKTSKGKLKQSGIVTGFGITAAVRPRGFGNLQVITSYSQGPHVFNFSLVNDLDIAEQEGQTRIKPIRIQPSLNFDIEI